MTIVDELKARMNEVLRGKDEVAKNIYRLAFSEVQLASARLGKDVDDDEAIATRSGGICVPPNFVEWVLHVVEPPGRSRRRPSAGLRLRRALEVLRASC
jgi:hypothetical protein